MGTEGNVIRNQNKRRIMIFSFFTLIFFMPSGHGIYQEQGG